MDKEKNSEYIEEINRFFNRQYTAHGNTAASLGWSESGQKTRFDLALNLKDLNGKTVLDAGSGLGHFASRLLNKYPSAKYTGYELNENFVKNLPKRENTYFENRDVIADPPPANKFDAAFSIGMLNIRIKDNESVMKALIKALYESCREMAAISMTSIYADAEYKAGYMYYYDPCDIFLYAKTLTRNASLYHNYLPHDFTVVLYKT